MPTANVNILAVLVAALATFVLGAVWYSPVLFAKQWMQAHGYTPEQLEAMKRRGVARADAVSALCYLVMADALALLASYTQATSFVQGLWLRLPLWARLAGANAPPPHQFFGQPPPPWGVGARAHRPPP